MPRLSCSHLHCSFLLYREKRRAALNEEWTLCCSCFESCRHSNDCVLSKAAAERYLAGWRNGLAPSFAPSPFFPHFSPLLHWCGSLLSQPSSWKGTRMGAKAQRDPNLQTSIQVTMPALCISILYIWHQFCEHLTDHPGQSSHRDLDLIMFHFISQFLESAMNVFLVVFLSSYSQVTHKNKEGCPCWVSVTWSVKSFKNLYNTAHISYDTLKVNVHRIWLRHVAAPSWLVEMIHCHFNHRSNVHRFSMSFFFLLLSLCTRSIFAGEVCISEVWHSLWIHINAYIYCQLT